MRSVSPLGPIIIIYDVNSDPTLIRDTRHNSCLRYYWELATFVMVNNFINIIRNSYCCLMNKSLKCIHKLYKKFAKNEFLYFIKNNSPYGIKKQKNTSTWDTEVTPYTSLFHPYGGIISSCFRTTIETNN